jgi:hypothetical protein
MLDGEREALTEGGMNYNKMFISTKETFQAVCDFASNLKMKYVERITKLI